MGWVLIFDSTGCRVLVVGWLGFGLFFVGDYLWRHEKHINRESYILLVGKYPVILLVDVMLYPSCSLVIDLGMLSCIPWFLVGVLSPWQVSRCIVVR